MINFRSSLLKSLPVALDGQRILRLKRRHLITALIAVAVFVPVGMVAFRAVGRDGFGRLLYHIHDTLYLWIKGNFYTVYFPDSLIWWGLLTTMFLGWLILYLADRSATRRLQIKWIRYVIQKKRLSHWLIVSARWLKKNLNFEQKLLYEVIHHQRTGILNRFMQSPAEDADYRQGDRLAHLTALYIQLLLLNYPETETDDHLKAADCFHESFFLLFIRTYGLPHDRRFNKLAGRLTALLGDIVNPIIRTRKNSESPELVEETSAFSMVTIAKDLLCLASLASDTIAAKEFGSASAEKPKNVVQKAAEIRLAGSVGMRYARLVEICNRLESTVFNIKGHADPTGKPEVESGLSLESEIHKKGLPILGRLSLGLALDVAYIAGLPEIALGYTDTYEALAMLAEALPGDAVDPVAHFIGDLPRNQDYRFCAELAEASLDALKDSLSGSNIIKDDDFHFVKCGIAALYQAGGPDFSCQVGVE